MGFSYNPLILCFPWLLIVPYTFAQSGCQGETSTYNKNGLVVQFKNLCGKDITATVDFLDPTNELTWSDCLDRCVEKVPLCYGFDFTPYGSTAFSCWLMNATFLESSALPQAYTVDAAMLSPEFLADLADDCRSLGLLGCFEKNGQLGTSASILRGPSSITTRYPSAATAATTTSVPTTISTTATSPTTPPSGLISKDGGLSTGTKVGIGVGIALFVLLVALIGGVVLLKQRKRRRQTSDGSSQPYTIEKSEHNEPHGRGLAELQAQNGPYGTAELPSPHKRQQEVYEIDGSTRYEKP